MIKRSTILLCVLAAANSLGTAAEEPLPFSLPVPDGWRTETLPFPLEFAPDLPYTGLEELRFAPGFFEERDDEFWTYAFIWWVGKNEANDPASLSLHLEEYFRGLAHAVAESRDSEVGNATFSTSVEAGPGSSFSGHAETFDAFVTNDQVRLNIRGNVIECPTQDRQAILFALSPQDDDHPVWNELDTIRAGFRCAPANPIVTDRPTDSASPVLVPRHAFQLELGYKFSRLESGSEEIDTELFPDLLARYGINKKVEARLVTAGWTFKDGSEGASDGFSDISLGAKIALAEAAGKRPQMSLLVDVSLPVGHSEITNDYVIPKVLFLGASTLTDRLALTYNLGPSLVTTKTEGLRKTNVDLNYAVALGRPAGESLSFFGELFGALIIGRDGPDRHNFQAGFTYLLTRTLQIDLRGGLGLVENEPDWLVGAGLAFRLPR